MTEMDAFERRVAETLRRYADDVTPVADAVEVAHRAALAHPRRLAGALGRRFVAFPHLGVPLRLAWLLLLLAGLLIALVGGLLIAGSQPEQKLSAVVPVYTCPPGTDPDEPGPIDQARPTSIDWPPATVFDRGAGKLVHVAAAEESGDVETWTFDVCTNTWTQMHSGREPSSLEYGRLVYDVDSDLTIGVSSGNVWAYDLEADAWTEKGPAKGWPAIYDPVSGLVIAESSEGLAYYDVETDAWTPIDQANEPGGELGSLFAYDTKVDRIIVYEGDAGTLSFDLRIGTWSRSGAETPQVMAGYGLSPPEVVYDEAAERTLVIGWDLANYDAAADRWEVEPTESDVGYVPSAMVYDPANRRLVGLAPQRGNDLVGIEGVVVAFELASHEWTVLLEPTVEQAVPSLD